MERSLPRQLPFWRSKPVGEIPFSKQERETCRRKVHGGLFGRTLVDLLPHNERPSMENGLTALPHLYHFFIIIRCKVLLGSNNLPVSRAIGTIATVIERKNRRSLHKILLFLLISVRATRPNNTFPDFQRG